MTRILSDSITVPADETPAYSQWGEVGSAANLTARVTVDNDQSPDLWIQWTDDPNGPEPTEDVDVFLVAGDPNHQHYHVAASGIQPAGAYIRVKGVAYGTEAGPCHVTVDTA